jgi:hypothetical protein
LNPDELFASPQCEVARSLTDGRPSALVAASSGVDINAPGRGGASLLLSAKCCARGRGPERAAVISGLARDVPRRSAIFRALRQLEIAAVDDLLDHGTNPRAIDLTGLSFGNVRQGLLRDAEPGITAHRLRLLRDRVVAPIEPREEPSTAATLCVTP